jgi:hypothetical protein
MSVEQPRVSGTSQNASRKAYSELNKSAVLLARVGRCEIADTGVRILLCNPRNLALGQRWSATFDTLGDALIEAHAIARQMHTQ